MILWMSSSESDIASWTFQFQKVLRVQQGCKNISAKIRILDVQKSKNDERKTDRTSKNQAFNVILIFSLDRYVTKHLLYSMKF